MRKGLIAILLLATMIFNTTTTAFAAPVDDNIRNRKEKVKQERVGEIMNELNRMAAEDKYDMIKLANGKALDVKDVTRSKERHEKKSNYVAELESLGVHKIDPENAEDMAMLAEMQEEMVFESEASESAAVTFALSSEYDTAPDFAMIANVYSLYIYNGTYKYNGTPYYYRYIRVVDDKGYDGLYYYQQNNLVPNVGGAVVDAIFSYNFGYGTSSLISKIPKFGVVLDWTLGNIFDAVAAANNAHIIYTTNKPLYKVEHASVTAMTYYFFYNGGWRHIGTSGNATVVRNDSFAGNIAGTPVIDNNTATLELRSNMIWYDFVSNYAQVMATRPNDCHIEEIGGLEIKAYNNKTYYFYPVFADLPNDLI